MEFKNMWKSVGFFTRRGAELQKILNSPLLVYFTYAAYVFK